MAPGAIHSLPSNDLRLTNGTRYEQEIDVKAKTSLCTDLDVGSTSRTGKDPVDIINSIICFRNTENQFWWERTGGQLAELLKYAGYEKTEQYNELLFFALHIVPELGPAPEANGHLRWRSPQTPDGTPLDLSWEWGLDGKGVIRTSFEPIGPLAGTKADPFNRFETDVWIRHLQSQGLVAGLDLDWYHHFTNTILPSKLDRVKMTEKLNFELAPVAGTFVTRDIDRNGPIIKMYMFPGLKAQELGISNAEVVFRAVQSLPADQYTSLNFEPLHEYLREADRKWGMEIGIFSFDLISPQKSRIKIYTRAPNTTVEYLMDALTLGGRYDLSMYSAEAIQDVKDFWKIFIGDAPDVLSQSGAERAGPGFYFTAKAGKPTTPKVYISPASFCQNDAEVLARLRHYFSTRRDAAQMLPQMDNYEKALRSIYGTNFLENTCDIHFYVSCALQKDQLRVVTYLCPQTLAREAELRKL
ncbi:4-O-dimethylallyl-L-tyrosine synthase [Ascochyta rabiei]|uniref:Tryptophan dimethylallyltransferase n=1 Tax=Didymella rabiei TaxID=5454 RepID=A0A163I860_DIDRA|nr:4-O-dimethylallyl-L-tyrosine synthase [Ascochyta rabiei]KZM25643.1 tryptophan dimethylallyltransferase [Ascochyta rabiei]UPX12723.1 4-O-dimethylallyl-L-tyrosine synthase [Ascochyta rabiei]